MRIIAGAFKGKQLYAPDGKDIRPTSDRTREGLFNILAHQPDDPITDQRVLDLCCGSGALGLEALSRGAAHASFIDNNSVSLALTKRNMEALGVSGRAQIIQANASALPAAAQPVKLVLLDPPYQQTGLVAAAYDSLKAKGWLTAGTLFCLEQSAKTPCPALPGAQIIKQRKYGRSEVTIYQIL